MTRTTNHLAIALTLLALVAVAPKTAVAAEGYYLQRNLITNFRDKYRTRLESGRKTLRNDLVLNAWGLALRPAGAGGHWWIANTDSGTVVTYVGDTDTMPLFQDALKTVLVEPAPATPELSPTPTGQVFSGSDEFPCSGTSFTGLPIAAPSRFLVVTEDGNLQCWAETGSPRAERMRSFTLAVNGESGSVYKGLAITPFPPATASTPPTSACAGSTLRRRLPADPERRLRAARRRTRGFRALQHPVPGIRYRRYREAGSLRRLCQDHRRSGRGGAGAGARVHRGVRSRRPALRTLGHTRRLNAPWGWRYPRGFRKVLQAPYRR